MITTHKLKKIKRIISHINCADGYASAMILKDAFPQALIELIQYGTPEHTKLKATEDMLFCDMSPPLERVEEFIDAGAIVLDHHKSAELVVKAFGKYGIFTNEPGISGAVLASRVWFEMCEENLLFISKACKWRDIQNFAELVGIRDTWQKDHHRWDEACEVQAVMKFYGDKLLAPTHPPYLTSFEQQLGRMLVQKRNNEVAALIKNAYASSYWFPEGKRLVAFINNYDLSSDAAEMIRQTKLDIDVLVGFLYSDDSYGTRLTFTMRSCNDNVDVSHVARINGGGGHKTAAGFTVRSGLNDGPYMLFMKALLKCDINVAINEREE